ncbi:hypothetical protein HKX48_002177 [Thoreauomyces humboldtii]|nr:hypothetical protein HKX48_002177 [Thoreauomyces humboldtii]
MPSQESDVEPENQTLQQEELLALEAIYDSDFAHNADTSSLTLSFHPPPGKVELTCHLPKAYPSSEMPCYEVTSHWTNRAGVSYGLPDSVRRLIDERLRDLFVPGEVVIFEWVEALKFLLEEQYGTEVQETEVRTATSPRKPSASAVEPGEADETEEMSGSYPMTIPPNCPAIVHSLSPMVERKSIFVAHVAAITSLDDVCLVMAALRTNKRIARATHNIMAYRLEVNGVCKQDSDDDGESAAGGRLLHMLELSQVTGAIVVVSRWYGGVQLGPLRFKLINNCARQLLDSEGFIPIAREDGRKTGKKR